MFDAQVRDILSSTHLSYFSRAEKVDMLFHRLDADKSGMLELEELMTLVYAMCPGASTAKAKRTLKFLDKDGDAEITPEEFREAMDALAGGLSDEDFDAGIKKVMESDLEEAGKPDPAKDMKPKFRTYVVGLPTFDASRQMGIAEAVKAKAKGAVFVDCRSPEEQEVSTIAGAIKLNIPDEDEEAIGVASANVDLKDVPAKAAIVAYCSAGVRGGLAAAMMEKHHERPVHNLTGGILQWFNLGKEVVGPDGAAVEAVHPGAKRCMGFVSRKSSFKLGGGKSSKKEKK